MSKLNAKSMIDGYARLKVGMSMNEVIALFGEPTGKRVRDGVETLTWKHSEWKGLMRGGNIVRTVIVDFVNGKVTGYDSENMDKSRW